MSVGSQAKQITLRVRCDQQDELAGAQQALVELGRQCMPVSQGGSSDRQEQAHRGGVVELGVRGGGAIASGGAQQRIEQQLFDKPRQRTVGIEIGPAQGRQMQGSQVDQAARRLPDHSFAQCADVTFEGAPIADRMLEMVEDATGQLIQAHRPGQCLPS